MITEWTNAHILGWCLSYDTAAVDAELLASLRSMRPEGSRLFAARPDRLARMHVPALNVPTERTIVYVREFPHSWN